MRCSLTNPKRIRQKCAVRVISTGAQPSRLLSLRDARRTLALQSKRNSRSSESNSAESIDFLWVCAYLAGTKDGLNSHEPAKKVAHSLAQPGNQRRIAYAAL